MKTMPDLITCESFPVHSSDVMLKLGSAVTEDCLAALFK